MPSFWSVPPSETARSVLRPAVRRVREVSPRMRMLTQGGRGPLAVFLPTYGREGAALVRIYAVAAALRAHGWRTLVLSPRLSLGQRHRLLARAAPDVLVLQGVRHDLNRPHLYPGQPIAMDLDDADFHLPHLAAALPLLLPPALPVQRARSVRRLVVRVRGAAC